MDDCRLSLFLWWNYKAAVQYYVSYLCLLAYNGQNMLLLSAAIWQKQGDQAGQLDHDEKSLQVLSCLSLWAHCFSIGQVRSDRYHGLGYKIQSSEWVHKQLGACRSFYLVQFRESKHNSCISKQYRVPGHALLKWHYILIVVEQLANLQSISKSWHGLLMNIDGVDQMAFNIGEMLVPLLQK